MGGGTGIIECAVDGCHRAAEMGSEGLQPHIPHLLSDQPPSQPGGVDGVVAQRRIAVQSRRRVEKRDVEANVVTHDYRVADELEEGGESSADIGCLDHHRLGDAGQDRDQRRDGKPGIDQGLKGPEQLTTPVLDRPDLGDGAIPGRSTGCLQVQDAEGDVEQRRGEIVEAGLEQG